MQTSVPNSVDIVADLHGGASGWYWRFSGMAREGSIPPQLQRYMTGDEYASTMQAVNAAIEKHFDETCAGMCADKDSRLLCACTIIGAPCLWGFLLIDYHSKFKYKRVTADVIEALRPWWEGKDLEVQFLPGEGMTKRAGNPAIIRVFVPEAAAAGPIVATVVKAAPPAASALGNKSVEGDPALKTALEEKGLGDFYDVLTQEGCTLRDLQGLSNDELEPFIKAAGMNLMQGTKFKKMCTEG